MYKFRACNEPPAPGEQLFDRSALSREQQQILERFKVERRIACEGYLSQHPEVADMIKCMYDALFKQQPNDPVLFAAEHFLTQCAGDNSDAVLKNGRQPNTKHFSVEQGTYWMSQYSRNILDETVGSNENYADDIEGELLEYRRLNPISPPYYSG